MTHAQKRMCSPLSQPKETKQSETKINDEEKKEKPSSMGKFEKNSPRVRECSPANCTFTSDSNVHGVFSGIGRLCASFAYVIVENLFIYLGFPQLRRSFTMYNV